MAFDKYIDNAWNQHAENAAMIAEGFKQGIALLTEPSQVTQLANLVTHVYGEHLGQFDRGLDFINQLMTHSLAADKEQKELLVYRAILQVSADNKISLEQFSISEQVRILATSASISAGLGKITGAAELFEKA